MQSITNVVLLINSGLWSPHLTIIYHHSKSPKATAAGSGVTRMMTMGDDDDDESSIPQIKKIII